MRKILQSCSGNESHCTIGYKHVAQNHHFRASFKSQQVKVSTAKLPSPLVSHGDPLFLLQHIPFPKAPVVRKGSEVWGHFRNTTWVHVNPIGKKKDRKVLETKNCWVNGQFFRSSFFSNIGAGPRFLFGHLLGLRRQQKNQRSRWWYFTTNCLKGSEGAHPPPKIII